LVLELIHYVVVVPKFIASHFHNFILIAKPLICKSWEAKGYTEKRGDKPIQSFLGFSLKSISEVGRRGLLTWIMFSPKDEL
jgi:hypothetical protein